MSDEIFAKIEETVEGNEDYYENLQDLLPELRKVLSQERFDIFAFQEHLKKGDFVAIHIEKDNTVESFFIADDKNAFILNYDAYGDYLDGGSVGMTTTGELKSFANVDLLPYPTEKMTDGVIITSNPTRWRDKAIGFLATIGIKTEVEGAAEQKWIVKMPSGNPIMYAKPTLKIYQPFNTKFPESLIKKLKEMFDDQKL
tara:strand:- start:34 stop:630 length:597 start_codon:yes stop_codon:yes gene_type:complete